jgi:hypothetical protein
MGAQVTLQDRKELFVQLTIMEALHLAQHRIEVAGFEQSLTDLMTRITNTFGKQREPKTTIRVDLYSIMDKCEVPPWRQMLGVINPNEKMGDY